MSASAASTVAYSMVSPSAMPSWSRHCPSGSRTRILYVIAFLLLLLRSPRRAKRPWPGVHEGGSLLHLLRHGLLAKLPDEVLEHPARHPLPEVLHALREAGEDRRLVGVVLSLPAGEVFDG